MKSCKIKDNHKPVCLLQVRGNNDEEYCFLNQFGFSTEQSKIGLFKATYKAEVMGWCLTRTIFGKL